MQTCNRRGFLTRVVAGTAAFAIVARAAADGTAPADGNPRTCANCAYFNGTSGGTSGTCEDRGGQPVPADGGCGNFK
jgi:hypothetical protein